MASFRHLRRLHEQIELLAAAARLPLPADAEAERQRLLAALCPDTLTPASAEALATGPLPDEARAFLRSLAALLPKNPAQAT